MKLETLMLEIIEGRRRGKPLLRALSYLYKGGVRLRHEAYDRGIFSTYDAGIPVISVGNIVAGGTGKTPLVRLLAEELSKQLSVAILSRGYRSKAEKTGHVLRVGKETRVEECGDEPYWLAQKLPQVQVWAGPNRVESARLAKENGAEVILLDDGMQHRQLKRDFEMTVVNGNDPFGKGFFLPRGWLRDFPERLSKADCIVVMNPSPEIETRLRHFTEAPLVFARTKTTLSLKGKKVGLFCAIGHPERFLQSVREAGGEIAATFLKPDHETFQIEELRNFAEQSAADVLVCTEKDQVKLPECDLPIISFPSQLEIDSKAWDELLNQIHARVQHDRRIPSHTS